MTRTHSMLERLKHTPIALFGCPLGLMGFALTTLHAESMAGYSHIVGGSLLVIVLVIFALLLVAYIVKAAQNPAAVLADWMHPVRSNFFAIVSGMFALIGFAILPFNHSVAMAAWVFGAIAHLAVTLGIASKWIGAKPIDPTSISPASFLPAVINALFPLAGVPLGFIEVSWYFFSVGFVLWLVLLPIIMWRLQTHPTLPDALLPTLVILIAPPSLLMMSYQTLDPSGGMALIKVLYFASAMFFLMVLTQISRLVNVNYSLAWWAYTFPVAAFTNGTLTYAEIVGLQWFNYFGAVLYFGLICTVLIVFYKTLRALFAGKIFAPKP